jgi:magnesium-transporting ATPase (P-type)
MNLQGINPLLTDSSDLLERLEDIPNNLNRILSNAIAFLLAICFTVGIILIIVGSIQWATGWDNREGKKTVVRGIVLITLSLIAGGGVIAGQMFL